MVRVEQVATQSLVRGGVTEQRPKEGSSKSLGWSCPGQGTAGAEALRGSVLGPLKTSEKAQGAEAW